MNHPTRAPQVRTRPWVGCLSIAWRSSRSSARTMPRIATTRCRWTGAQPWRCCRGTTAVGSIAASGSAPLGVLRRGSPLRLRASVRSRRACLRRRGLGGFLTNDPQSFGPQSNAGAPRRGRVATAGASHCGSNASWQAGSSPQRRTRDSRGSSASSGLEVPPQRVDREAGQQVRAPRRVLAPRRPRASSTRFGLSGMPLRLRRELRRPSRLLEVLGNRFVYIATVERLGKNRFKGLPAQGQSLMMTPSRCMLVVVTG